MKCSIGMTDLLLATFKVYGPADDSYPGIQGTAYTAEIEKDGKKYEIMADCYDTGGDYPKISYQIIGEEIPNMEGLSHPIWSSGEYEFIFDFIGYV